MPEDNPINLGDEPGSTPFKIKKEKVDVNQYDIFRLAKSILIVAAVIYLLLALIRIFYSGNPNNPDGIKEVWEYSKVFLNSVISLVLGLYFGSNHEATKKKA